MPKLYVMIGVPASGKSTFAKKLAVKENAIHISRDEIRNSMLKQGEYFFSKEKQVYKEFLNQIQINLGRGKDVIADATHLNRESRDKLLRNLAIDYNEIYVIGIIMDTPYKTCIERNAKREGVAKVPYKEMIEMINNFRKPSINENFDE